VPVQRYAREVDKLSVDTGAGGDRPIRAGEQSYAQADRLRRASYRLMRRVSSSGMTQAFVEDSPVSRASNYVNYTYGTLSA
jgi:hypothetical protein